MDEQNSKPKRPQDDIPYEMRMKYIIEAYRKDIKKLEELTKYAQGLEEENLALQKKMDGYDEWLQEVAGDKDFFVKIAMKIRSMQSYIKQTFPKRVVKTAALNATIMGQKMYIKQLQKLLDEHGIVYPERIKDPMEMESSYDIEHLDIYAVRGKKETFEGEPLDFTIAVNK